jgi:hypothetical protein
MIIIKTYWKIAVIVLVVASLLLGTIYVTPLEHSTKVGAMTIVISPIVAVLFGDLAGTFAARRFQEQDAKRARVAALQSLINEVARIQAVIDYYEATAPHSFLSRGGIPKMPIAAFETAFVSGSPGLAPSEELMEAVSRYLVRADSINSLIDIYLTRGDDWSTSIRQQGAQLTETFDEIRKHLQKEKDCLQCELES